MGISITDAIKTLEKVIEELGPKKTAVYLFLIVTFLVFAGFLFWEAEKRYAKEVEVNAKLERQVTDLRKVTDDLIRLQGEQAIYQKLVLESLMNGKVSSTPPPVTPVSPLATVPPPLTPERIAELEKHKPPLVKMNELLSRNVSTPNE